MVKNFGECLLPPPSLYRRGASSTEQLSHLAKTSQCVSLCQISSRTYFPESLALGGSFHHLRWHPKLAWVYWAPRSRVVPEVLGLSYLTGPRARMGPGMARDPNRAIQTRSGGNAGLSRAAVPGPIWGPTRGRLPAQTSRPGEGRELRGAGSARESETAQRHPLQAPGPLGNLSDSQ